MADRLFIIGAGGFGRQLEYYLDNYQGADKTWKLIGYLDDDPNALDGKNSDYTIMGNIQTFKFDPTDKVAVAIADTTIKTRIVKELEGKVKFLTFIARDVMLGKSTTVMEGTLICPGAKIGNNVTLGRHSLINLNANIGHDSKLGDFCSIMPNVDIGGNSVIGDGVFIGTKGTLAPGVEIAPDSHIGIGAVILKSVKEAGTYFGNPARKILK